MPKFTYVGPHDAVDVLGRVGVKRGEPEEFTAAEAKTLGPDFEAAKKPAKSKES